MTASREGGDDLRERERSLSPDLLRACFAAHAMGDEVEAPVSTTLGAITLAPHQREAVVRCRALLRTHGGAILADQVGLGKTFVALALAAELGGAHVIGPAALRDEWARAAVRTGGDPHPFTSFEALSSGETLHDAPPLLIVDEAHHARTPSTRRHAALRALGARTPMLLLTATPVHNRARDLAALARLFAGARAHGAGTRELQALVVRRTDASLVAPPVRPHATMEPPLLLPAGDDLLDALLRLPPPVAPRDAGRADALVTLGLVRAWASSDAALVAALRRRIAMARALADALAEGRHPSRAELSAWTLGDDAQQLALPLLVVGPVPDDGPPRRRGAQRRTPGRAFIMRLRRHADAHADHARELFARLTAAPSVRDAARAAHLRILLGADAGPVLAFTHSADTARALGHLLRDLGGVAALTADGAEIADGRLSRREALVRFAPRAQGAPAPHARDAIRLLIATDLLAEGLNLQDARVVVHLDVPWTPARLEQRVGRVARPGSPHETVRILRIAPPASAEAITHAERTLRAKLAEAERVVGALPLALGAGESASIRDNSRRASPGPSVLTAAANELEARELVRARLAAWRAAGSRARANGEPADDTVRFASNETTADVSLLVTAGGTWIASVRAPAANPAHRPHLVAGGLGAADATMRAQVEAASDHPLALLAAIEHVARAAQLATSAPHAEAALAAWRRHRDGAVAAGLDAPTSPSPTQRHALARVSAAVALAPPHLRAHRASLAERARALLRLPASAQRDSLIQSLTACHPADDDHWLLALATCAANDAPPV